MLGTKYLTKENNWLKSISQTRIWTCEPEPLNNIIEEFYATVRTKDREDYEDDGFREMVAAVDGYLTEKEYKGSITLEWGFKSLKQVLEGKTQQLQQQLMNYYKKSEQLIWETGSYFCLYVIN